MLMQLLILSKKKVKDAGGNVDGVLRFSIKWNEDGKSIVDLDAHAVEPDGTRIQYNAGYRKDTGNNFTKMGGQLDLDMISPSTIGLENIYWNDLNKMKSGNYKFIVHNYNGRRNDGVRVQIEFQGQIVNFEYNKMVEGYLDIAEINLSNGVMSLSKYNSLLSMSEGSPISKNKWGIDTNKFHNVSMIMNSPNHWDINQVGMKHLFFMLEGCKNDESNTRGFYNEFLKEDLLLHHKRAFEVVAGMLKLHESDTQLSGLGFSSTQRNSLICKVEGSFNRTLKIII